MFGQYGSTADYLKCRSFARGDSSSQTLPHSRARRERVDKEVGYDPLTRNRLNRADTILLSILKERSVGLEAQTMHAQEVLLELLHLHRVSEEHTLSRRRPVPVSRFQQRPMCPILANVRSMETCWCQRGKSQSDQDNGVQSVQ